MGLPSRIVLIGNALPRKCGIATFTMDLQAALAGADFRPKTDIVAMNDEGRRYHYPNIVVAQINEGVPRDYEFAAATINRSQYDVVSLQHEFGIFGGPSGSHILDLLARLTVPVVTTLHTILEAPTLDQAATLKAVISHSKIVVVMAEKGRALLKSVYGVAADKIRVIPHGVPDTPFSTSEVAKAKLGYAGRTVILTFGLLSPGKGVEIMIDALPRILQDAPDAVYVVLGATHPHLVRAEGEAYRRMLWDKVLALGLEDHVVFEDGFVERPRLLDFIAMCDVYVTPYLNASQMTSGTLAYSFGLGKAVVSTPYWHAEELLADGRGVLTPFGDSSAIGLAISSLLKNPERRHAMALAAYQYSRSMTWARTAQAYLAVFAEACAVPSPRMHRIPVDIRPQKVGQAKRAASPSALLSLSDDTGIYQHAIHAVPDRRHGYCVDDNARALIVACGFDAPGERALPERQIDSYAAFLQHAWNPDLGRFRNFMSFDRRWLEAFGSEDSHGRAVWALGVCASASSSQPRRAWATDLLRLSAPATIQFTSPRAWAFTLLGLHAFCAVHPNMGEFERLRRDLAERLVSLLEVSSTADWTWFEAGLSYDNARLCECLILTGRALDTQKLTSAGLRALHWLVARQTAPSGLFRPIGTDTFGTVRALRPFDQQPLEAAATIAACAAAWRYDANDRWLAEAQRAFAWFHGANDLGVALADEATGGCRDGLHPDRRNENQGAESVLSYLLADADLRRLHHHVACVLNDRATLAEIA